MDEENEKKMEALKKAYAEIILNTSKEAAARLMASERKAKQFEHDLKSTKEEASRMLLRLKQMLDAKTTAARVTYSSQQQKIDELEAQLNEAEGVIIDLREELKQTQDQLIQVKKYHVKPLSRQFGRGDMSCVGSMPLEENLSGSRLSASEIKTLSSHVNFTNHEICTSAKQTEMPYPEPEKYIMDENMLASVRSGEPELCKKGCTERTNAIEKRGDEKGLPGQGAHVPIKSETAIRLNEPNMKVSSMSSFKTERCNAMGNLSGLKAAFGRTKNFPLRACKTRKRKSRFGKSKFSSCKFRHCRSMRSQLSTSSISHRKSLMCMNTMDNPCEQTCTAPSVKKPKKGIAKNSSELVQNTQLDKDQEVSVVRRSLRKRKMKQWDDFTASYQRQVSHVDKSRESYYPCSSTSYCKTSSVNCNVKSVEEKSNLATEAENICNITGLVDVPIHMRTDRDSTLIEDTETRNSELIDKSIVVKQGGFASELEVEKVLRLGYVMSSETADAAPSQAESGRLLKYTFCRKRKKGSLIYPDENSAVGESSKKRSVGKQSIASRPQGSDMRNELSNHSRRVVQVARQLLSLSGQN